MEDEEVAYVRNIVKEIVRECSPRRIKVNKNFLNYLTKILLINPNWGIDHDFFNQRQNVQMFVKYVIEELLVNPYHPNLLTLKMQFYFSCSLDRINDSIDLNRYELKKKLSKLKEDICLFKHVKDKEEVDRFHKKIVYYITLLSGLGDPTNFKVFEEVLVALKSILDDDDLNQFVASSNTLKLASLEQFTKIVTGIRLFNKHCEKGGEGIANLPELLKKAIHVMKQREELVLLLVMERVNVLTTVVDRSYIIMRNAKGIQVEFHQPKEILPSISIDYLKDLLIFFRQYELIIRKLIEEIEQVSYKSDIILRSLERLLEKTYDTVFMKLAIPVGIVFPLFEEISDIWTRLQNQVILLARFNEMTVNLEIYARHACTEEIISEAGIPENGYLTDAERLEITAHQSIKTDNPDISVYSIENFKNIDTVKLEYLGFCCWKLIETKGALVPGNPSMGIVRYCNRNYVFSSVEASEEFCKKPEMFVNCVLDLAREKPQLIHFLQLKEELDRIKTIEKLVHTKSDLKLCEDKAVDTDDYIAPKYINPTYRWNIWDYKRKILSMVNITRCATISVQSDKFSSSNVAKTQTYSSKDASTNTVKDNHTNVPKPSNYIYGLRGRKDDQQFIIDLTLPIEKS